MSSEISEIISLTGPEADGAVDDEKQQLNVDADVNCFDLSINDHPIDDQTAVSDVALAPTIDKDNVVDVVDVDIEGDDDNITSLLSQIGTGVDGSSSNNETPNDVFKRSNNYPYESNQWERFESVEFCAYRVLPNDMSLNGRAFAISVFLRTVDCRFNCGDIVELKDGKKAVFLGVRYDKNTVLEAESGAAAALLLYFFTFSSSTEGTATVVK